MSLNATIASHFAESLVSVAEVSAYISSRSAHPAKDAWESLDTAAKEGCCRQASDDVSRLNYCLEPLALPGFSTLKFPLPLKSHRVLGGTLTSSQSSTQMADAGLADVSNLYPDDFFKGGSLGICQGACSGKIRRITAYNSANGGFTTEAFDKALGEANYLLIWPLPVWTCRAVIEQAVSIALWGRNPDAMRDSQMGIRSVSSPGRSSGYFKSGPEGLLCPEAWNEIRPYLARDVKVERA